jgi:hypothetical protein
MRRSFSLLAVGALTALAVGSAAALNVSGGTIQAGVDSELTCDDAIAVAGWGFEENDGLVYNVRIGGISVACLGHSLFVTVTSAGSPLTGSIPSLTAGQLEGGSPGTATISFTPQLPGNITALSVVIEGGS